MGLEFGEGHLDRIEVGTVRREEEEPGPALLEDGLGLRALVAGQVVEDHHVARLQARCQLGLDVDVEGLSVHGVIDHPRRDQAIASQSGDEGLRGPVSERRPGLQAGTAARAAAQTRHLGRRAGLIEEDQTVNLLTHERLAPPLPVVTRLTHVLAPGFRRQQRFF
jgi:hypothetical protein